VRVALALAFLLGPGHALVALLVRRTELFWFERWSLAFLIGTAAMSGAWLIFGGFYDVIRPAWLLSGLSLVFTLAVWSRIHRHGDPRTLGPEPNTGTLAPLDVALSVALAAQCVVLLLIAMRTPLGWDGLFNFELKARLIFENDPSGRLPLSYLSDASRVWSHPQYPLMVPFAEFWIYTWLGRIDQAAIKILFPLFYFCLVGLLCGAVRRASGVRMALMSGIAIGLLPVMTVLPGAVSGYADVPLGAAVIGSVSFACLALTARNGEAATLAGVLSAIAIWTKSEGTLLAGSVAAAALATGSPRRMLPLLWIPVAALSPWWFVQQRYGIPSPDFAPFSASTALAHLPTLQTIGDIVMKELLRVGHWGLLWPAWGLGIVFVIAQRRSGVAEWFLIGSVLIPLMLYVVVFACSAWADPLEHARLAVPRLLVPLAPIALLFTALGVSNGLRLETS
jgi:hypothetical protein